MADMAASVLTRLKNKAKESGRLKEYYDIYYLSNKFDFDGATLTEALKKTFENRGHDFTADQFEQVIAFHGDEAMQKKWKAFVKKINTKTDDFKTVLDTIKRFMEDPFRAANGDTEYYGKWSAYNGVWN